MSSHQTYLPGFEPPQPSFGAEIVTDIPSDIAGAVPTDKEVLWKVSAARMREVGITSTLIGLQIIGTLNERLGITSEHYIGLMQGVAKQLIRDEKRREREERKRERENA